MLNDYLRVLVPVIFEHNGTVDKFLGDGILAIFGSPAPDPKHHENALRAAAEMQVAISKLNEERHLRSLLTVTSASESIAARLCMGSLEPRIAWSSRS